MLSLRVASDVEGSIVTQPVNLQTIVLEQAKDQKINLELLHSTDWVVAISIMASCVLSLIGFLITAYVVRKTTEQTIVSNSILVKAQNDLKQMDLKNENLIQIRKLIAEYYFQFELFENASGTTIHNHYIAEKELNVEDSRHYIKEDLYKLNALAAKIVIYLDLNVAHQQSLKQQIKQLSQAAWALYLTLGSSYENAQAQLEAFRISFEALQQNLSHFILMEQEAIYALKTNA